ncbi:MAG: hypothetical protein EA370_06985 [Wenzhouxiangella sp.]|nr:MAG: hypothetical protein EA370_06985 [Wenzhouxiangella sp.]
MIYKHFQEWLNRLGIIGTLVGSLAMVTSAHAQITFFVDSLADDPLQVEGDNLCVTDNNECTFRAALEAANNRSDTVTIEFNPAIPTDVLGRSIIQPSSPLPAISNQVIISGESHPDFSPSDPLPRFLIDGATAGGSALANGLYLVNGSQGSEVRFLAAYNFTQSGFVLGQTSEVTLEGNYSGLRPISANTAETLGNGAFGIWISASDNNFIENNWIGDNGFQGIIINSGSADNVMVGNRIGQRPTAGGSGVAVAGNGLSGIQINADAGSGNEIGRCVTISTMPFIQECRGNFITANAGAGIHLIADNQSVYTNRIGVAPEEPTNAVFGNTGQGILIESSNNTISSGLNVEATANIIGHNQSDGILIHPDGSNNMITGTMIGTNSVGEDLGNADRGVFALSGGNTISNNRIANNSTGIRLLAGYNEITDNEVINHSGNGVNIDNGGQLIQGNIVGHNQSGIAYAHDIDATPQGLVSIFDNHIGVRPDGTPIPNNGGILGWSGGFTRIGNNEGRGNVIGHNENNGISLASTSDARIQANWIGVMPDGAPAGNGGSGIHIGLLPDGAPSNNNRIGYTVQDVIPDDHADSSQALGNIIAYNNTGIYLQPSGSNKLHPYPLNNAIRGNRFIANSEQAIDLGPGGDVTDPGGSEDGPNRLQNFPEFETSDTYYNEGAGSIEFTYTVNTTSANASYPLLIDFYIAHNDSRQGHTFLYTDEYTGFFAAQPKSGSFSLPAGLDPSGSYLVATATDNDGNSSQFSEAIPLTVLPDELFSDRFEEVTQ